MSKKIEKSKKSLPKTSTKPTTKAKPKDHEVSREEMRPNVPIKKSAAGKPAKVKDDGKASKGRSMIVDPRTPPVGTVLQREFNGKTHKVTVKSDGFYYEGRKYTSLSTIATEIAGGHKWNGWVFFKVGGAPKFTKNKTDKPAKVVTKKAKQGKFTGTVETDTEDEPQPKAKGKKGKVVEAEETEDIPDAEEDDEPVAKPKPKSKSKGKKAEDIPDADDDEPVDSVTDDDLGLDDDDLP